MLRFEPMSKRRHGYPSESQVKRGSRTVKRGEIELLERLGNNDPCPCGSGRRFQAVLSQQRPFLTEPVGPTTGATVSAEPEGGPRPPDHASVAQRTEHRATNPGAEVRILSGA